MNMNHNPIDFTAVDIGLFFGFRGIDAAPKLHTKNKKLMDVTINATHKPIFPYAEGLVYAKNTSPVTKATLKLEIIVFAICFISFGHNVRVQRPA